MPGATLCREELTKVAPPRVEEPLICLFGSERVRGSPAGEPHRFALRTACPTVLLVRVGASVWLPGRRTSPLRVKNRLPYRAACSGRSECVAPPAGEPRRFASRTACPTVLLVRVGARCVAPRQANLAASRQEPPALPYCLFGSERVCGSPGRRTSPLRVRNRLPYRTACSGRSECVAPPAGEPRRFASRTACPTVLVGDPICFGRCIQSAQCGSAVFPVPLKHRWNRPKSD